MGAMQQSQGEEWLVLYKGYTDVNDDEDDGDDDEEEEKKEEEEEEEEEEKDCINQKVGLHIFIIVIEFDEQSITTR